MSSAIRPGMSNGDNSPGALAVSTRRTRAGVSSTTATRQYSSNADSAPSLAGYRFLANPHKETMQKVQHFRAWMVVEMAAMRRSLEGEG